MRPPIGDRVPPLAASAHGDGCIYADGTGSIPREERKDPRVEQRQLSAIQNRPRSFRRMRLEIRHDHLQEQDRGNRSREKTDDEQQAARELGITERTVKAHRHRVFEKLHARTVADLVSLAERLELLQQPEIEV